MEPSQVNPYYKISYYYGSRDKGYYIYQQFLICLEFYSRHAILSDNLTVVTWSTYFTFLESGEMILTDNSTHVIFKMDQQTSERVILVG